MRRLSESDGNRPRRALSEAGSLDDSGISSSGGSTPPLAPSPRNYSRSPSRTQETERTTESSQQPPRLHRPWADSSSSPTPQKTHHHHQVQESLLTTPSTSTLPLDFPLFNPFLVPSSHHHHFAALEIARFQHQMQQHCFQTQHLTKFYHWAALDRWRWDQKNFYSWGKQSKCVKKRSRKNVKLLALYQFCSNFYHPFFVNSLFFLSLAQKASEIIFHCSWTAEYT